MKRSRLKHEVVAPLEIITGPEFSSNEELFIKAGPGRYEYNFKTKEFKFNGKQIELFPIIKSVADWYEADQAAHRIDVTTIESSVLKIELMNAPYPGINLNPHFQRLFHGIGLNLDSNTEYIIHAEMIIKTDERTYLRWSSRGLTFDWITSLSKRWKVDREGAEMRLLYAGYLLLALVGLLLVKVHTMFTILTGPISGLTSFHLFNRVSHALFQRGFKPPRKFDDSRREWSDLLLALPYLALAAYGMFCFGEIADWMRHEDAWPVGWQLNELFR